MHAYRPGWTCPERDGLALKEGVLVDGGKDCGSEASVPVTV